MERHDSEKAHRRRSEEGEAMTEFKKDQAARHALLSHYCATGDTVAQNRMIQSIELHSKEQQESIGLLVKIAALGAVNLVIIQALLWVFS
ncbi:MAG: hypothetical protein LW713_12890 [Acetobacteraceae bacterium]|nr:hypothetical protein [Acetobacteraceae bacterium]